MTTTPGTVVCNLSCCRRGRREPPCRHAAFSARRQRFPRGRAPRVSRLLALALPLDGLVRAGVIADYATLAAYPARASARS